MASSIAAPPQREATASRMKPPRQMGVTSGLTPAFGFFSKLSEILCLTVGTVLVSSRILLTLTWVSWTKLCERISLERS